MDMKHFLRGFSLAAVLLAGSCAAHTNDASGLTEDGAANHPIMVEPSYESLKLSYAPADSGISPADQARFDSPSWPTIRRTAMARSRSAPRPGSIRRR